MAKEEFEYLKAKIKMRGITLISLTIFLLLSISVIAILWYSALPLVKKLEAATLTQQAKGILAKLDSVIQEVAQEGKGSRRILWIDLKGGKLELNSSRDSIYWLFQTPAQLISPRTALDFGNLRFGNNLECRAYQAEYGKKPVWVLENEHLKVFILRTGNESHQESINTSELLLAVYQKDLDEWLNGSFEVMVNDDPETALGKGWTEISQTGEDLPYVKVRAHIHNDISYWVDFILESGADFLILEGELE